MGCCASTAAQDASQRDLATNDGSSFVDDEGNLQLDSVGTADGGGSGSRQRRKASRRVTTAVPAHEDFDDIDSPDQLRRWFELERCRVMAANMSQPPQRPAADSPAATSPIPFLFSTEPQGGPAPPETHATAEQPIVGVIMPRREASGGDHRPRSPSNSADCRTKESTSSSDTKIWLRAQSNPSVASQSMLERMAADAADEEEEAEEVVVRPSTQPFEMAQSDPNDARRGGLRHPIGATPPAAEQAMSSSGASQGNSNSSVAHPITHDAAGPPLLMSLPRVVSAGRANSGGDSEGLKSSSLASLSHTADPIEVAARQHVPSVALESAALPPASCHARVSGNPLEEKV